MRGNPKKKQPSLLAGLLAALAHPATSDRFGLILMGAVVGSLAGLEAVLLTRGLSLGGHWLQSLRHHWWALFLPGLGAGAGVWLLRHFFREAGGHGVPEVIYSIARRGGLLRLRSVASRLVSSLLTIASGGSAGPEGPIVISGAATGSRVSMLFGLNDRQRTVTVAGGAAGAISAIFNAPMAGIAFALESILGRWSSVHLIPIAVASIFATELSRLLSGNQIPFQHRFYTARLGDLAATLGLALICALVAVTLVRSLRLLESIFEARLKSPIPRAMLGGSLVGAVALFVPVVSGEGYEWVRQSIEGSLAPGLALAGVALLAKVLATATTLGSGGSGGIFAPCLLVGSLAGLCFCRSLAALTPFHGQEGLYALLGMAGLLSAVLQAPLTAILLVLEITGSQELALPVVLVSVLSATLSQRFERHSVYHQELMTRGVLLRPMTDARILADVNLPELIEQGGPPLRPGMKLKEVAECAMRTGARIFPVLEEGSSRYLGSVKLDAVRALVFDPRLNETILVEEIMDKGHISVGHHDTLREIMACFESQAVELLPVMRGHHFLGYISKVRALEQYRKELIVQEEP